MENRNTLSLKLIVGGALISALLITTTAVLAYDQKNTHPALTDEIVDFYNLNFPDKKLTNQEKQWLIQGAIEEDIGERPLFHFYDPVHNRGIAYFSSKEWALKSSAQANYYNSQLTGFAAISGGDSANDFSYERALNDYTKGDRKRAFIAFGHILHLLEDAGVPDHTRNDAHPAFIHGQESPYEHEMAKWSPENFQVARKLFLTREKPIALGNMSDYFDKIANYSNNNFFSKDTISNIKYKLPKLTLVKKIRFGGIEMTFIVNQDKNGTEIPIALIQEKSGNISLSIYSPEIGNFILDGYWDRLSKEIILNGAGALNLFLTEAEKAKTEYVNQPSEKLNWFSRILGLIGISTSDSTVVDNSNIGDSPSASGVTPTPKVTNSSVSPTSLVTKTPDTSVTTNVTILSPTPSPSKIPAPILSPTPKLSTAKKSGRVVINEIAWTGTLASATDEWIELYNTENVPVDISSWQLVSNDDSPDIIFSEETVIQANSYFLVERTDDNTVSDITADLAVGFGQGGLNNAGEMVRLFDSTGAIVDVVGDTGKAWYFGDSNSKNSMERTDPMKVGNDASNWKSFSGTPVNKDVTGGWVYGTPKAKNSMAILVVTYAGGGGSSSSSPTSTPTPLLSPSPIPSPSPTPGSTEKININTGSKDQLMTLWGIGDAKSDAIIEYRTTNGSFKKIEDIMDVSGIGQATFDKIKDDITVGNIVFKPSAVTDLVAGHHSPTISATWSAPDSGGINIASLSYDLRYSTLNFPDTNSWDMATKIATSSLPSVSEKGASQSASFNVAYEYGQTLYFALKVIYTTMLNIISDISNVAPVSFPSAIDDNAWAMFGKDQYHTSFASNLAGPGPGAAIVWEFDVSSDNTTGHVDNVFRSNKISASCVNGGNYIRLYDYNQNSQGAFPCSGGAGTWNNYFNTSYNDTIFTEFEQVGTLPCGTFGQCSASALSVKNVVLRIDGWTPTGSLNNAAVSADGDVYFGATVGSSNKLIKLNKNGVKQWEYGTNVSIGMPVVLSDETIYFGRVGAGGTLAFTALNSDGSKKWDYDDASTVKVVTVLPKGEPYFTFQSGNQDKLIVLKADGTLKTTITGSGLSGFAPVVLDNGTTIVAKYLSGNQFFNAYSSNGIQIWPNELFYTGANGNVPTNPSYDSGIGKTYSAAGSWLFDISSDGSVLNTHEIDPLGIATTTVAISSDTLYLGFNDINPASGSRLFAINKSDLTTKWAMPFSADSRMNSQLVVDKDDNIYFSTEGGTIYGIDKYGSQKWKIDAGTASVISPVLVENGLIWGYGNRMVKIE